MCKASYIYISVSVKRACITGGGVYTSSQWLFCELKRLKGELPSQEAGRTSVLSFSLPDVRPTPPSLPFRAHDR